MHPAAGISLIELVIVMVLIGVLATLSAQPLLRAFHARSVVSNNLTAIDSLRYATERMVRELRQARYDARGTGFQLRALDPISGISNASSGLCFERVGGNEGNTLAQQALRVTAGVATLDSVSFPVCTPVQPQALATRVSGLRFDYWTYGAAGNAQPLALSITDPDFGTRLAFIDISLTVSSASGSPVSYRSRVVLRNGAWGAFK